MDTNDNTDGLVVTSSVNISTVAVTQMNVPTVWLLNELKHEYASAEIYLNINCLYYIETFIAVSCFYYPRLMLSSAFNMVRQYELNPACKKYLALALVWGNCSLTLSNSEKISWWSKCWK